LNVKNISTLLDEKVACLHDSYQRALHFETQILRVLTCTAKLLANPPGGFRFKVGSQPWLLPLANPYLSR